MFGKKKEQTFKYGSVTSFTKYKFYLYVLGHQILDKQDPIFDKYKQNEGESKSSWNYPEVGARFHFDMWSIYFTWSLCKVTHFYHYLLTVRPKLYNKSVAAAEHWNNLPLNVKNSLTIGQFKKCLKTHLFTLAF